MIKMLGIAAILASFAGTAMAGPNAGGVLIIVTDGSVYCSDDSPYCSGAPISGCETGVVQFDGAQSEAIVLNVLATFSESANNRLAGVTFGLVYNEAEIFVTDQGSCGDFELAEESWPGSGSGTAVTWNTAQTDPLIDVYWFAAYNYYGNPNTLVLAPHPIQGAQFADDSIPSSLDGITGFGAFGFDTAGTLICPREADLPGACCEEEGFCELLGEADCQADFQGTGTVCEPNPCPRPPIGACCAQIGLCSMQTEDVCRESGGNYLGDDADCEEVSCVDPVLETSWGEIKNTFR